MLEFKIANANLNATEEADLFASWVDFGEKLERREIVRVARVFLFLIN
jgi:hypothetical protein